jgi:hypothetical protein
LLRKHQVVSFMFLQQALEVSRKGFVGKKMLKKAY